MYNPSIFREDRPEFLAELMRQHPLANLVTLGQDGLLASHIPLIYEAVPNSPGVLHGHIARANTQWRDIRPEVEALAIFMGAETYISPSWYATKQQSGRVVPTWNYTVVHAHGKLETYFEADRLRKHLELLTQTQEAGFALPWTLNDAPTAYINDLLAGIVGINIQIVRLEGKFKVNQNQSAEDRAGVVRGLSNLGGPQKVEMARLVCAHAPKPSP